MGSNIRQAMEFRILGPLEVLEAGRSLQIPGGKARALLAILLLNANEVQSTDRLIDLLWGEDPPATADKALQVHVSQLRKALTDARAPNSPIHTRPPGYVLALEAHQLDLLQFLQLVDEGGEPRLPVTSGVPPIVCTAHLRCGAGLRCPTSRSNRSRTRRYPGWRSFG
jgi:hypothetical protein